MANFFDSVNIPTSQQYRAPGPYDEDYRSIARREQLAQALQQQAFQPIEAGSYNGIQAPISPLQGLGKVLQMYLGSTKMDEADQARRELEYKAENSDRALVGAAPVERQQKLAQALQTQAAPLNVSAAPTAMPVAQPVEQPVAQAYPVGPSGATQNFDPQAPQAPQTMPQPTMYSLTGNPEKDAMLIKNMGRPAYLAEALKQSAPSEFTKGLVQQGIKPGSPEWVQAHKDKAFADTYVRPPVIGENQTALNPKTMQPAFTPTDRTAEKAFLTEVGKGGGKNVDELYKQTQNSQTLVDSANRITDLIDKGAFTGPDANIKLAFAKGMNVLGADNNESIKNAELLVSTTAGNVLNSVKTSGLGTGQGFTDKDRDFLEKVVGGKVTLNGETLKELARIQKHVAKESVNKWNSTFDKLPETARSGYNRVDVHDYTQDQLRQEMQRRGLKVQ
jgi:hypothetical protein